MVEENCIEKDLLLSMKMKNIRGMRMRQSEDAKQLVNKSMSKSPKASRSPSVSNSPKAQSPISRNASLMFEDVLGFKDKTYNPLKKKPPKYV